MKLKPKIIITGGQVDPGSQADLDAYLASVDAQEQFHRILVLQAEDPA